MPTSVQRLRMRLQQGDHLRIDLDDVGEVVGIADARELRFLLV